MSSLDKKKMGRREFLASSTVATVRATTRSVLEIAEPAAAVTVRFPLSPLGREIVAEMARCPTSEIMWIPV